MITYVKESSILPKYILHCIDSMNRFFYTVIVLKQNNQISLTLAVSTHM